MQSEQISKALQEMQAREQRKLVDADIEARIKILSAVYDKATTYTNLMIVAAYAGYFGLWQLTKEYLPKPFALWSALLMLVSVVTFVAVEVIKMVMVQHSVFTQAAVINSQEARQNLATLQAAFAKLGAAHEQVNFYFKRFWVVALVVTIASGMSAVTLLGYSFVLGLQK